MWTKLKEKLGKFKKWIIALFIGGTALATISTVNFNGAILTEEVELIPIHSVSTYKFNTPDGLLHMGDYATDELGYLVEDSNSSVFFKRADILDTTGMTKVEITDRWGKAYSFFKDSSTQEILKYEISKSEYDSYKTREGLPHKTLIKQISYKDAAKAIASLFRIKEAFANVSRFSQAQSFDEAAVTSLTWAVSTGTNANRVIIVGVGSNSATGQAVTYAGTSLTLKVDGTGRMKIFALDDPASGSNNIVFSQSVATLMYGGAGTYQNAGTTSATADSGNGSGDTAVSVAITTNNNNAMILGWAYANALNVTITMGQTQIQVQELATSDFATGNNEFFQAAAGAKTMTATASVATDIDRMLAIEITTDDASAPAAGRARRMIIE